MTATTKKAWVPPRGIRYRVIADRPKPYLLLWKDETGAEKSEAFKEESHRESAARALAEKRDRHGSAILDFDPVKWARYREFQKLVGKDIDPLVVATEWLASKQGKPTAAASMLIRDAWPKYMLLRKEEKSWSHDAARHANKHLERFSDGHGARRLNEISAEDVRAWLRDLKDRHGEPIGEHGVRDHRKNVNTFFEYALREKWGVIENPCAWVKPPTPDDGDPVVISVRDAFHFFKANRDEWVTGRVALEAFGAIRYKTAGLLQKDAINFDRRGIRMAAKIHKSGQKDGRSRYRQGQPDNLYAWLAHAPERCWNKDLLDYREAKRFASIRAGIRPLDTSSEEDKVKVNGLRNVWRHSFISYHLARFKSLPLTQYLAQHANSKMTEDYEGLADEEDAARYFNITPETVLLSWDEFVSLKLEKTQPLDSASLSLRLAAS